jgi:mRNA interferase MazF
MTFNQFEIWLADLNPQFGTEAGKLRPVLIVQTDLLNNIFHSSVLVCPITTNIVNYTNPLRVHLAKGMANLHQDCEVMIDQIRAIDSKRLIKKIGNFPQFLIQQVKEDILIMFDID